MKDTLGYVSFQMKFIDPPHFPANVSEFMAGDWFVSHNYDHYSLWELKNALYPDRLVTICIIRHGYKFYSGCAVLNPKDSRDKEKGEKVAFDRCLTNMLIDAQITLNITFSTRFCKEIRKAFWTEFLSQL